MDVGGTIGRRLKAVRAQSIVTQVVFFGLTLTGILIGWRLGNEWLGRIQIGTPARDAEPVFFTPSLGTGLAMAAMGGILGAFAATILVRIGSLLLRKWEKLDLGDRVTVFAGVLLGLLVASPLVTLFSSLNLEKPTLFLLVLGIGILSAAIAVYALQSMGDVLPWSRGKGPAKRTGIKILDTNVIIDGRIYDVARTGFLEGEMYVPRFVLEELQYIADSHDALRRQRGKRGLDVLKIMQTDFPLEVGTHDRYAPEQGDGVDSRLVRLARAIGADLVTNDHNLNRVATLQSVRVLNINDLALSLRPNVLPQEKLNIQILREGNQPGQGIGYLDDGTMVVIENGKGHIGETRDVLVTQV
ncbi:TRAM domain-containing protein, partial [bacterium]